MRMHSRRTSSSASHQTQAKGRSSRSAHCANTVVFPYPAGATNVTTGPAAGARSRLTSAVLRMLACGGAGISLSIESSAGTGSAPYEGTDGEAFVRIAETLSRLGAQDKLVRRAPSGRHPRRACP